MSGDRMIRELRSRLVGTLASHVAQRGGWQCCVCGGVFGPDVQPTGRDGRRGPYYCEPCAYATDDARFGRRGA